MATATMPGQPHPSETSRIVQWLEGRGFRQNPFEYTNAEYELKALPGYYVDHGDFDTLFNLKQPCLVYAGRGCGKTAQRQMLAAQCRPNSPSSPILAINYTYESFERAFTLADSSIEKVQVTHHIDALLHAGMAALVDEMERDATVRNTLSAPETLPQIKVYLERYGPERNLLKIDEHSKGLYHSVTPFELLSGFSRLLRKAGFQSGMVFVDGLGESLIMTSEPEHLALFLSNILGTLPIIECPGLAFKFFLSQDFEQVLLAHDWYRPDRFYVAHIAWDKFRMLEMFRQRLVYFSKRKPAYESLAQICDDQLKQTINEEIIQLSGTNPRFALGLANMLIHEHVGQASPSDQISAKIWEAVKEKWKRQVSGSRQYSFPLIPDQNSSSPIEVKSSPLLRIEEEKGLVWLGEDQIRGKLTPQDYQVLVCLYRHLGAFCNKEIIVQEAWEESDSSGVSDAAIAASVRRIRAVFKGYEEQKEFIQTIRGKRRSTGGYRLIPEGFLP